MTKQSQFGVAKVMFSNGSGNILFLSYRGYGVMSINSRGNHKENTFVVPEDFLRTSDFCHTVAEKENVIPQFSR